MDAAALPYRVERCPVGGHRGDVVHAAIDRAEQLVDRLELRLAALVEAAHQVAVHLDGLADIDEGARSAREEAMRDSLAEGVALEVVHSHGDEGEGGVGVVVEKAERHDADAGFEGEEVGLVVRSALWKDRYALVLRQSVPHGGEHLVIVDVGEELEREREAVTHTSAREPFEEEDEEDEEDEEKETSEAALGGAGFDLERFSRASVSLSTSCTT